MNEVRTVAVPPPVLEPLRETVVLLLQSTADSLSSTAAAASQGDDSLEEAQRHRSRVGELAAVLDQLGWSSPGMASPNLTVNARQEVLHDAAYGALIDSAERLAVGCSAAWRREATADDIALATAEVALLTSLLFRVDAGPDITRSA